MNERFKSLTALALTGAALASAGAGAAPAGAAVKCRDAADASRRLDLTVQAADTKRGERAFGYYAVPRTAPRGIVAFAHGHGNSAWKWRDNLRHVAKRLEVIAVAMDYRRQTYPGATYRGGESFGWRVREGAEDSIAAARLLDRKCRPRGKHAERLPIVMWGVSMGGNASGLAVASRAKRTDGSPLFDHWFDIEGVTNVIETYFEARAAAGPPLNNKTGQVAVKEIEEAFGGPFETRREVYTNAAVVTRAEDMKAGGLKGVVMIHGADDGTVPYNQSPEMFARLAQAGIPTDFYTVGSRGDAPSGNTLEDTFGVNKVIPGYTSPFSGHGGENDRTHPVIRLGFRRLAAYFERQARPTGFRTFAVDHGLVPINPAD